MRLKYSKGTVIMESCYHIDVRMKQSLKKCTLAVL